jgi:spermidine/putrescine transport system permease protein
MWGLVAVAPATLWMVAFFLVPLAVFAVYSVLTAGLYAVSLPVTADAYVGAVTDPLNRTLAWNSVVIGGSTALIAVALGLPIAFWIRFSAGRARLLVLFLFTASLFASYLVRIYAWRSILGGNGLINDTLQRVGVISEPLGFLLYSRFAVIAALIHIFLPFVVLVLYAAMTPVNPALLEAARDLGAGPLRMWSKVVLPVMAAPAFNAFMFVFILSAADYVTPQFLGGQGGQTIGARIQTNFVTVGNWPEAAATSILLLLTFLALYQLGAWALRARRLTDLRLSS